MPLSNRSSIIANQDVAAATFIVGNDLSVADFQRIEDAILNLPSTGGSIGLLSNISITPPVGGYVLPTKPVRIFGAGTDASTINVGSFTGPLFTLSDQDFTLEDVTFLGTSIAAQTLILNTAPGAGEPICFLKRVRVGTSASNAFETIIDADALGRHWRMDSCYMFVAGVDPYFFRDGGNGELYMVNCDIRNNAGVSGTIPVHISNSVLISSVNNIAFAGTSKVTTSGITAPTTTFGSSSEFSSSRILGNVSLSSECGFIGVNQSGGTVSTTGSLVKVHGSTLSAFTATGGGLHSIVGNDFFGGGDNCTLASSSNNVVGDNTGIQVLESGTANNNRFDDNQNFSGSTIIGTTSTVNGAKRFGSTGATVDAYATLFTHTNAKGLMGIGTIKNTDGADSLTIEEQVIDAFGVTTTVETVVTFGDTYMLDLQTNFDTTGFPPYVSYRVRVKSTSPGNPASYSIQFVSQGDVT